MSDSNSESVVVPRSCHLPACKTILDVVGDLLHAALKGQEPMPATSKRYACKIAAQQLVRDVERRRDASKLRLDEGIVAYRGIGRGRKLQLVARTQSRERSRLESRRRGFAVGREDIGAVSRADIAAKQRPGFRPD